MKISPASIVIWALAMCMGTFSMVQAQTFERRWALSVGGAALQYVAPTGTPTLVNPAWNAAGQISADRFLSGAFDFRARLTYSPAVAFPTSSESFSQSALWDMHYQMVFKVNNGVFMKQNAFIGPFASFGFGGSFVGTRPDAYVPLSAGMRFRVNDKMAFRLESMKKFSLNKDYQNVVHALAFVYNLDTQTKETIESDPEKVIDNLMAQTPLPNDWDADGIADWLDECPQEAGYIHLQGCPAEDEEQTLLADATPLTEDPESYPGGNAVNSTPSSSQATLQEANQQAIPRAPGIFPYVTYEEGEPFEITYLAMLGDAKAAPQPAAKAPQADEWADASAILPEPKATTPQVTTPAASPAEGPANAQTSRSGAQPEAKPAVPAVPTMTTYGDAGPCGRPGETTEAGSIFFDPGADKLPNSAYPVLMEIAEQMKSCGDIRLVISGHADHSGNQRDNLVLSIMRAYNVKYYLVYQHGIPQSRITSKGFGAEKGNEESGESKNEQARRVDFQLTH